MTSQGHDARLAQLGITLPKAGAPAANYVPARKSGSCVYIAGQVPTADGKDQYVGKVGKDVSIEDAQKAARLCGINILAQLRTALGGSLDSVVGCVRLGGFVNATPEFGDHPRVINGASDLMVEVFGDAGRHARAAVGCNSLPRNVAVEVDAIFEITRMSTGASGGAVETPRVDERTPIHVLTGFLGSGKTTLLRHLLADRELADTAVVINEFGEVGLDHLLVREVAEDVVLLSSGCMCCSVRDDLVSTLAELHGLMRSGEIPAFSRIVVETTGLADPAPIMQAILSEQRLTPHFRLGQMITTVDAVNGEKTWTRHREARQQLATADRVIVTKTDLVEEDDIAVLMDKLAHMNPSATLLKSGKAQLPASQILKEADAQWRRPGDGSKAHGPAHGHVHRHDPHAHDDHPHDQAIKTFTVQLERPIEWPAFVDWLELLLASRGDAILRVKGLLEITDDDRPVVVQGVQQILYPIERLPRWPDESARPGWIVFIARDLTQRAIENSLRSVHEHSLA